MSKELTNKKYWEKYYKNSSANLNSIEIAKVYDSYWELIFKSGNLRNVLEIGAYPGRYLSYVAKKYKLEPTAIDYQTDLDLIYNYFNLCNIDKFNVISADFLTHKFHHKFDLVMSIGFVEHFDNFIEIIKMQCDLVDDNGFIFIQVPNKKGLRFLYGLIADYENLKSHNLKVMNKLVFEKLITEMGFDILALDYTGTFQFSLHNHNGEYNMRYIFYKIFRFLFKTMCLNTIVEKYPSRFWSASIVLVAKRK